MSFNIAILGSICMDIAVKLDRIPKVGDVIQSNEFKMGLGGKASNAAVAMARLNESPLLVACVGIDSFSRDLKKVLTSERVDLSYLTETSETATGSTIVEVDHSGKNIIIVNKNANYKIATHHIDKLLNDIDSNNIHIDLFYTTLEPKLEIIKYAIDQMHKRNISIFCDAAPDPKGLRTLLPIVDFVAPNQKEAEILSGVSVNTVEDAYRAATEIRKTGANTIIITLSKLGAVVLEKNQDTPKHYGGKAIKAIDETAAGDSFRAAFCVEYLKTKDVTKSVMFANKAGAVAASKFGAYESMPRWAEIGV